MSNFPTAQGAIELKSGSITLPILKILNPDLADISTQLDAKIGKAPDFFKNAPVIIDLGELDEIGRDSLDFGALLECISAHALSPVGMRGGSPAQQKKAKLEKVAVLAEVRTEQPSQALGSKNQPRRPLPPPRPQTALTKIVDQPVRSGQRIYAAGGDLIVLSQVSPGAEIMADGNIHVYGALMGRALAGVQGNLEARIFCSDLKAQLIAIGGHYRTSEDEDRSYKGRLVQVAFNGDGLVVTPL